MPLTRNVPYGVGSPPTNIKANVELSKLAPVDDTWEPNYADGITYDNGYPGLIVPESFTGGKRWDNDGDWLEVDPRGIRQWPDIGGTTGIVGRDPRTDFGGVQDIENFDLTGEVQAIPDPNDYYAKATGPVGGRSLAGEVGDAIYLDHLDVNPDPYAVRENIAGGI